MKMKIMGLDIHMLSSNLDINAKQAMLDQQKNKNLLIFTQVILLAIAAVAQYFLMQLHTASCPSIDGTRGIKISFNS